MNRNDKRQIVSTLQKRLVYGHPITAGPNEGCRVMSCPVTFYLKTPFVADLPVQVEIHFYHQQSVTGPREPRAAAAVRSRHVAGSVEVSEVVVSCESQESRLSVFLSQSQLLTVCRAETDSAALSYTSEKKDNCLNSKEQITRLFFHHQM